MSWRKRRGSGLACLSYPDARARKIAAEASKRIEKSSGFGAQLA